MQTALAGAILIAAVSTAGDFVWAGLQLRHRMVYGLAHGAALFLCIGAFFGWLERKPLAGALWGALIGLVAAGCFYLLAPVAGYGIMAVIWAFVWLAVAALAGRVLNAARSWRETLTRAALAMTGSGAAFFLISGIWRPFDPQGWDYAVHFFSWTVAYLPAFLALTLPRPAVSD